MLQNFIIFFKKHRIRYLLQRTTHLVHGCTDSQIQDLGFNGLNYKFYEQPNNYELSSTEKHYRIRMNLSRILLV